MKRHAAKPDDKALILRLPKRTHALVARRAVEDDASLNYTLVALVLRGLAASRPPRPTTP